MSSSGGSSNDSNGEGPSRPPRREGPPERETDPTVLERREKQIEYGKNTLSYDAYISKIPPNLRRAHHPITPKKHIKYSRRQWDGLVKAWKKRVHALDTENETPLSSSHNHHLKRKRKDWSSSNSRASSTLSLASSKWPDEEGEERDKTLTPEMQEPDLDRYECIDYNEEDDFPFLPSKDEIS